MECYSTVHVGYLGEGDGEEEEAEDKGEADAVLCDSLPDTEPDQDGARGKLRRGRTVRTKLRVTFAK